MITDGRSHLSNHRRVKLDLEYGKGKTENILPGGKNTTNLEDRGYFGQSEVQQAEYCAHTDLESLTSYLPPQLHLTVQVNMTCEECWSL